MWGGGGGGRGGVQKTLFYVELDIGLKILYVQFVSRPSSNKHTSVLRYRYKSSEIMFKKFL